MSYGTADVYYQPEAFGLVQVAEIDSDHDDYGFDLFVVWKDSEGNFYYGSDAGCSCPSPFEEFTSLSDLTRTDRHGALAAAHEWNGGRYNRPDEFPAFVERILNA